MNIKGRKTYTIEIELSSDNGEEEAKIIDMLMAEEEGLTTYRFKLFDFFKDQTREFVPYKNLYDEYPAFKILEISSTCANVSITWYITKQEFNIKEVE